ncbi:MAG TPA: carboxypeptidase-like regulatory domain-containing protein [Chitinophagaceae bacterium]|nr:carboxypeptidase-like regulatory domain-containing protein [Chitinophagaceae bacterium]
MKRYLLFLTLFMGGLGFSAKAQFERLKDSVVQLYGVVMTADSLRGIPAVSVVVKGQNRGTVTNDQGVFSIVVMKGDVVEFTSIGYKPKLVDIPRSLEGNQYSVIQLMVTDTVYLPATIIKPRPTREQFDRDFVNTNIPADDIEIARQNTEESKRRVLMRTLPADAREAANVTLRNQANRYYSAGQMPPQNIFNPMAWAEFIQAWKRGDFKNK